jgi:exosome complex component RRP42
MDCSNITKETIKRMFAEGKRFDSRGLFDFRPIEVSFNVSNKAEGSARVKIGKTEVVAGVKMEIGEPYPDSLDKGNLTVSGDLLPLASPRFEAGPPKFNAVELLRLVDRVIRHSGILDFKKLVITPGEKVWTVIIDIYPINDDGNIIDAASIAAVAALKKTMVPALDENGRIDYHKESKTPLQIEKDILPVTLTFFKLGDSLALDLAREEEEACDARVVFGISKLGDEYFINSCQKGEEVPLTKKEIDQIMGIISEKFEKLNEKLKKFF